LEVLKDAVGYRTDMGNGRGVILLNLLDNVFL
jgi:hypothetical protein